jgi:putative oxidoreductase
MKRLGSILRLDFIPASADCGLLALRLWLGISMLALHGWTKLSNFQAKAGDFGDPLGIGSKASLSLAVFGEVVGSLLVILGLFTRFGALAVMITMGVAFFLVHGAKFGGPKSGELAFIYLGGFFAIFLAGPGRFSIDGAKGGKSSKPNRDGKR